MDYTELENVQGVVNLVNQLNGAASVSVTNAVFSQIGTVSSFITGGTFALSLSNITSSTIRLADSLKYIVMTQNSRVTVSTVSFDHVNSANYFDVVKLMIADKTIGRAADSTS